MVLSVLPLTPLGELFSFRQAPTAGECACQTHAEILEFVLNSEFCSKICKFGQLLATTEALYVMMVYHINDE